MSNTGGVSFAGGAPRRAAAPGAGYQPLKGFARSLRILVADDEKDTVLTLRAILEDEGHEVRGVYKGGDVLSTMHRFEPEAVILDISMPDVSGFQLAKEICDAYGSNRPLLIAISGIYNRGSDRILSEVVGFDHHLAKPCEPRQILSLLDPLARN